MPSSPGWTRSPAWSSFRVTPASLRDHRSSRRSSAVRVPRSAAIRCGPFSPFTDDPRHPPDDLRRARTPASLPPLPPWNAGRAMPVLPIALLLLLVVAAAAGVVLLLRPHVAFTNALAAPVRLVVGDGSPRTVAPGSDGARRSLARANGGGAMGAAPSPLGRRHADGRGDARAPRCCSGPSGTTALRSRRAARPTAPISRRSSPTRRPSRSG